MTMDSAAIHKNIVARNQSTVFGNAKLFVGGDKPTMVSKREDLYGRHHSLSQSPLSN